MWYATSHLIRESLGGGDGGFSFDWKQILAAVSALSVLKDFDSTDESTRWVRSAMVAEAWVGESAWARSTSSVVVENCMACGRGGVCGLIQKLANHFNRAVGPI